MGTEWTQHLQTWIETRESTPTPACHSLPLEEGDVEDGRIEVDELEQERLHNKCVLILRLSPVHLCNIATSPLRGNHDP